MLEDVIVLFAPTYRSRAYVQLMRAHNLLTRRAIAISGDEPVWDGEGSIQTGVDPFTFKPGETAHDTLESAGVCILEAGENDVNSAAIVDLISSLSESIVVYSGPPGVLLKDPILSTGKRFLHIHGGIAPEYRGSTAFYFSLLREGTIGATALYLDTGIDTGPIVSQKRYVPERGADIDRILDPLVRASVLVDILRDISQGNIPQGTISNEGGTTYHVIHPVLKHLAIIKANSKLE